MLILRLFPPIGTMKRPKNEPVRNDTKGMGIEPIPAVQTIDLADT